MRGVKIGVWTALSDMHYNHMNERRVEDEDAEVKQLGARLSEIAFAEKPLLNGPILLALKVP